jgi:hypothetical protein
MKHPTAPMKHQQVDATSQQPNGILSGLQRAATVNNKGATASLR